GIADAVAVALTDHRDIPIVIDPVMIAKGGAALLAPEAVYVLTRRLLPLATLLTPNLPEAAALATALSAGKRDDLGGVAA
ncbi:bifunctional hydroxymethylpyrimidine kinase/phosphomethylpyrimidine kinase, partial [Rhizobium johnstonii]|uniref:bifunctional hydroxymethylpyrimidine kinase/phosphomethylpyrimidine kinase n=1 Tax=Rhizobium johnstonii TaxID=3019933 RepID=UPI003F97C4F8